MTVSEAFAELTENILSHEGFKIRYTIRKKKYPGKTFKEGNEISIFESNFE